MIPCKGSLVQRISEIDPPTSYLSTASPSHSGPASLLKPMTHIPNPCCRRAGTMSRSSPNVHGILCAGTPPRLLPKWIKHILGLSVTKGKPLYRIRDLSEEQDKEEKPSRVEKWAQSLYASEPSLKPGSCPGPLLGSTQGGGRQTQEGAPPFSLNLGFPAAFRRNPLKVKRKATQPTESQTQVQRVEKILGREVWPYLQWRPGGARSAPGWVPVQVSERRAVSKFWKCFFPKFGSHEYL